MSGVALELPSVPGARFFDDGNLVILTARCAKKSRKTECFQKQVVCKTEVLPKLPSIKKNFSCSGVLDRGDTEKLYD